MVQGTPYWYNILSHFEANHYFHNGLTIPFLIGASKVLQPDHPLSLAAFFYELCNADVTRYVSIMRCDNIGEYIVRLLDIGSEQHLKQYKRLKNMICTDNSFSDFDTALEILEEQYSS